MQGAEIWSVASAIDWLVPYVLYALLISARVGGALMAMPAPFGSLAPVPIRAITTMLISAALTIAHGQRQADMIHVQGLFLLVAALGEVMVGAIIGLSVRVVIAVAEIAGTLSSFAMGLGFATAIEPNYGESSAPPTQLLAFFSMLMFFIFEGHQAVLMALGRSLEVAPPGHVLERLLGAQVIQVTSHMVGHGLKIAGPVVATMMMIQIGLALAARAAPKVHLMYLSFAISIGTGVTTLFVAAPSLATAIVAEVRQLPMQLAQALGGG